MSNERKRLIKSFGASIILVSPEEGGFLGSIEFTKRHQLSKKNVFLPRQFDNFYNVESHYMTTGPEIYDQMKNLGITIDAFIAGVGTGGTIMGAGGFLKEKYSTIKIHPLEPANSPTLSTGYKIGKHRTQGISDEFIPSIIKLEKLDSIIQVDNGDAIIIAQKLSNEIGLGVGISSGANFLGAIIAQEKLGVDANVVTVFSDCNKKYLSTDLCYTETKKDDFMSPDIQLIGFEIIR
ncbi:PLP-dependent cysteine synthase family protein [Aquimarina sp. I32.4]|uniref:PLP-dependent cysteine synthase family protein n=1 Tax=Aquimarina sp. I32.4 TaxID=2053903 RepID=UPI0018EA80FE|nr:pyridoxal-phosphate dependent enzyme [Aquimarina sp. I32.4]